MMVTRQLRSLAAAAFFLGLRNTLSYIGRCYHFATTFPVEAIDRPLIFERSELWAMLLTLFLQ